jgi:hypothetical protein
VRVKKFLSHNISPLYPNICLEKNIAIYRYICCTCANGKKTTPRQQKAGKNFFEKMQKCG